MTGQTWRTSVNVNEHKLILQQPVRPLFSPDAVIQAQWNKRKIGCQIEFAVKSRRRSTRHIKPMLRRSKITSKLHKIHPKLPHFTVDLTKKEVCLYCLVKYYEKLQLHIKLNTVGKQRIGQKISICEHMQILC